MPKIDPAPFHDRIDVDIPLRDASLDPAARPTQRMIAAASLGKDVEDAYYSVREVREAVAWIHDGDPRGKPGLAAILSNDGVDDFQRCIYFCLAGRGVVAMLDDLMWLEALLETRGLTVGKLMRDRIRHRSLIDPYVASAPDGPVGVVAEDFEQGPSWWLEPMPAN